MHIELKKAIVNYMFDNVKTFGLTNATTQEFKQYIYTPEGHYIIGGQEVSDFIEAVDKHIINPQN